MVKFIKLHKWVPGRNPEVHSMIAHGAPVWVNVGMITQMVQFQGVVNSPDGPKLFQDRPREIFTSISFPAGTQEGTDGVAVIESPEEIFRIINGA